MARKKPAAQLEREIAAVIGPPVMKARTVGEWRAARQPILRYWIAPASDPRDRYAAGYDGNAFRTRREAERAIRDLRRLGGEWNVAWIVNED